jgi:hypothetical protein
MAMRQAENCAPTGMAYYRFEALMLAHPWQSHGLGALLGAAGLLLFAGTPAHAHGPPPSAFGIVAAASSKPTLVVLNEGLAIERPGGWAFLCPSLWGEGGTGLGIVPLALSIDGVTSFIVGADDLYIARDGVLSAQRRPELSRSAVLALVAADGDALFGLTVSSGASRLVRIDDPDAPPLYETPDQIGALEAHAGRFHLGRFSQTGELEIRTIDRMGSVVADQRVQLGLSTLAELRLRVRAERMFVLVIEADHSTLGEVVDQRWQQHAQLNAPIAGPETSAGGQVWIALDNELMRETASGFEAVGEARRVTCLGRWGELAYACVGTAIHRLEDDGLGDQLFALDRLAPPDPSLVPAAAADDCEIQWSLFRGDLERVGLAPRAEALPPSAQPLDAGGEGSPPASARDAGEGDHSENGNGCSAGRGHSAAGLPARWWLAAMAYGAATRWRRRAAAATATSRVRGTGAPA